jgi:S1-C subfamily serine protease
MGRKFRDEEFWRDSPRRGGRSGSMAALLTLSLIVVFGVGVVTGVSVSRPTQLVGPEYVTPVPGSPSTAGASNAGNGLTNSSGLPMVGSSANQITAVYNSVKRSICTITAISDGSSKTGAEEDIGTGFLINDNGDIATNDHVVNGQPTVTVTFGHHNYQGTVIGKDKIDDLAIVHITPPAGRAPLVLGTSAKLVPGQFVIAIGNPFQLTESVTFGIVSGLNRSMPMPTGHVMDGLIQTDAPLNPGNSGGPLLNAAGQVVGIDTAIESPIEGSVGIGFAIPIDRLERLLPTLLRGGQVQHAWLGIAGIDINSYLQSQLQLPVGYGVYVEAVSPHSPAERAGLRGDSGANSAAENGQISSLKGNGDIIVGVNGQKVTTIEQLTNIINHDAPGQKLTLNILRNGQKVNVVVTLGNWPTHTGNLS